MDVVERPSSTMSEQERAEEFSSALAASTPTATEEGVTRQEALADEQTAKEQQVFREQQMLNQQGSIPLPDETRTDAPLATGAADYLPNTDLTEDVSTEDDTSNGLEAVPGHAQPNNVPEPPVDPVLDKPMAPMASAHAGKGASVAGTGTSAGLSGGVAPTPAPNEQRGGAIRRLSNILPGHGEGIEKISDDSKGVRPEGGRERRKSLLDRLTPKREGREERERVIPERKAERPEGAKERKPSFLDRLNPMRKSGEEKRAETGKEAVEGGKEAPHERRKSLFDRLNPRKEHEGGEKKGNMMDKLNPMK